MRNDDVFLIDLAKYRNKILYAKVYMLNEDEVPFDNVEGKIIGGSLSLDGLSSKRRSCSGINITLDDKFKNKIINTALVNRFSLSIGVQNDVSDDYPKIIWFDQGIFITTQISVNNSGQKVQLSISGQDKMSRLDGTLGGNFFSQAQFDIIEEVDNDGNITKTKIPIKDIIFNLLYEYIHEKPENIIINDLEEVGYELLQYNGAKDFYIVYEAINENECIPVNYTTDVDQEISYSRKEGNNTRTFNSVLNSLPDYKENGKYIKGLFYKQTFKTGDWVGYHPTSLIYPKDLIANAGETVESVLKKIKDTLVNYEYFYDTNGKFIFQKKPQIMEIDLRNIIDAKVNSSYRLTSEEVFKTDELIKSISHSIDLTKIKNDFSVWGQRTSASGAAIDIHARVAIDVRPQSYNRIHVTSKEIDDLRKKYPEQFPILDNEEYMFDYYYYYVSDKLKTESLICYCDWRELIYAMAEDYFRFHLLDDFAQRVEAANPWAKDGITGYEQYYTDIQGFWRQLYHPDRPYKYSYSTLTGLGKTTIDGVDIYYFGAFDEDGNVVEYKEGDPLVYIKKEKKNPYDEDEYEQLTSNISSDRIYNLYYGKDTATEESKNFFEQTTGYSWEKYQNMGSNFQESLKNMYYPILIEEAYSKIDKYIRQDQYDENGWTVNLQNNPSLLNFWFDFIEPTGELIDFSVPVIGSRTKVESGNKAGIKTVLPKKAQDIQLLKKNEILSPNGAYQHYPILRLDEITEGMFSIASSSNSCFEKVSELLNTHTQLVSGISLTTIPIYHLQLNSLITLNNQLSGIEGDYVITKISLPLTYNGTMNITANKIYDNMEVQYND